ncbi:MAG: hypothetical protein RI580_10360 [Halothece sp. Uz-M2-17]|nr:hypothetical protein [Halothece sp. Uz-M2-17]
MNKIPAIFNYFQRKLSLLQWHQVVLLFVLSSLFFALIGGLAQFRLSLQTSYQSASSQIKQELWSSQFKTSDWLNHWGKLEKGEWGLDNLEIQAQPNQKFETILRVYYPAHSASPTVARKGFPLGGAQFYGTLNIPPQEALLLSYYVRFPHHFQFVKGGKLPGLFGGKGNNGGEIPDGTDGFSTRYMWREQGKGEIYAYLPTSQNYGTSMGRGHWQFKREQWYHLQQKIVLNQPNQANGVIQVWVNGKEVIDQTNVLFRTTDALKIDGILFSTFFGGGDASWATPEDTYAEFANFSITVFN